MDVVVTGAVQSAGLSILTVTAEFFHQPPVLLLLQEQLVLQGVFFHHRPTPLFSSDSTGRTFGGCLLGASASVPEVAP